MFMKFITEKTCYSELNEIKIKILIKVHQTFQAKKNSDAVREKSINRYKNDTEDNIISWFLNWNSLHENDSMCSLFLPRSINIIRNWLHRRQKKETFHIPYIYIFNTNQWKHFTTLKKLKDDSLINIYLMLDQTKNVIHYDKAI